MLRTPLLRMTSAGLYCEAGGFHIDPCEPVAKAIITHGHADHLTRRCKQYLTAVDGHEIVAGRLGPTADVATANYGETLSFAGTTVSLHPAGHILGSAQVRIEHRGEVWVVTGDYKTTPDVTCAPFEPVRCHTLITESTFGHPFFAWPDVEGVVGELHDWWRTNQAAGKACFLYVYALGKAQRVLAALDPAVGPIYVHPDIAAINAIYARQGAQFPTHHSLDVATLSEDWTRSLFLFPPSARWHQPCEFHGHFATGFVSGWMLLADGPQRRRVQTGFAVSDHADYSEILAAIDHCGAERVGVMHGYVDVLVADLQERGRDAFPFRSPRCKDPPVVRRE
ncbi:MAG: ligase-associated DNA damage response exonuclease [Planctomycetaceae bacterium]|nr:ligase-associated DNA damage response exonuclease [Planctomycetaceae bacterium]